MKSTNCINLHINFNNPSKEFVAATHNSDIIHVDCSPSPSSSVGIREEVMDSNPSCFFSSVKEGTNSIKFESKQINKTDTVG